MKNKDIPILILIVFILFIIYLINPKGFPPPGVKSSLAFIYANIVDISLVVAVLFVIIIVFVISDYKLEETPYNREATITFDSSYKPKPEKSKKTEMPSNALLGNAKPVNDMSRIVALHKNQAEGFALIEGDNMEKNTPVINGDVGDQVKPEKLPNKRTTKVNVDELCDDCNDKDAIKDKITYRKKQGKLKEDKPFKKISVGGIGLQINGVDKIFNDDTGGHTLDEHYFKDKSLL